jgi:hypothetical protein
MEKVIRNRILVLGSPSVAKFCLCDMRCHLTLSLKNLLLNKIVADRIIKGLIVSTNIKEKPLFTFGSYINRNNKLDTLRAKIYNQYSVKGNLFGKIENHRYIVFEELMSIFEEIWKKYFDEISDRKTRYTRIMKFIIHKSHWHQSDEHSNFSPMRFLCECHFHNSELGCKRAIVHATSNSKKNAYFNYSSIQES